MNDLFDFGAAAIFGAALGKSAAIYFTAAPLLDPAVTPVWILAAVIGICAFLFAFGIMRMAGPGEITYRTRPDLHVELFETKVASAETPLEGRAQEHVAARSHHGAPEPSEATEATEGLMGAVRSLRRA